MIHSYGGRTIGRDGVISNEFLGACYVISRAAIFNEIEIVSAILPIVRVHRCIKPHTVNPFCAIHVCVCVTCRRSETPEIR